MRQWLLPITLVCLISGFALGFQLKMLQDVTSTNPSQKNSNLVTIITDLEREIKSQEDQIEKIRQEMGTLQAQESRGKIIKLQEQLKNAQIMAGLTPVSGKGIIITLDDNREGLQANPHDDPNKYIIHYENILSIVSELKAAGAEAVSVNQQRLITTSEIRCVGNVILVNTTRLAPPFVIQAIGSPKLLVEMVTSREYEILRSSKFPVSIKESDEVIIPAYKGELPFTYSQSTKEG